MNDAGKIDPLDRMADALADGVRVFVVRGAAGTGKTTLIGRLIQQLKDIRYDVALLAPTGRAAKMIQLRTRHEACTIHSSIYKIDEKPQEGQAESGDLRWVFPLKTESRARTCFIVDEASMVGSALHNDGILQFGTGSLLQDLVDYSGVGRPNSDNLLVFVGDPYQLPPVKEKTGDPPALDERHLSGLTGCRVFSVELTVVHRQNKDSGILAEANRLRSLIACRLFGSFQYRPHPDIHVAEESAFEQLYHPETDLNDKIVIAYTNERVWSFNSRIRKMLGHSAILPEPGEHLMSLRNTTVGIGGEREARFMNGDLLQVISVDPSQTVRLEGFYRPKGAEKAFRYEFVFCKMTVGWLYETDQSDAEVWVNVTPITSAAYRENAEYASIALYVAVSERIRQKFGLGQSKADEEKLREYLKRSQFYHAPWVTFGYAVTGHKSQGGEWNEVWVDYRYQQNRMTEDYFRWMYTVTTRARKLLFVLAPPCFDDLADALSRGIERLEGTEAAAPSALPAGASLSLFAILSRHGYVAGEVIRRPYSVRVQISKQDDPFAEMGTLDFNYNGKNVVSYVRLAFPGASDGLGADIAALKGRNLRTVMPEETGSGGGMEATPVIEVSEPQAGLRDRLLAAAEKAGLRVLGMKSLTANHLRLELSSELGEGYVDFYIDGKGRVTEMGSMTVGAACLKKLRGGLGA